MGKEGSPIQNAQQACIVWYESNTYGSELTSTKVFANDIYSGADELCGFFRAVFFVWVVLSEELLEKKRNQNGEVKQARREFGTRGMRSG